MSSLARLRQTIASLPSSNLSSAKGGTVQISQALNNIVDRAFPSSAASSSSHASSSATATDLPADFAGSVPPAPSPPADPSASLGPGEQRALERMAQSLERLKSNAAANEVRLDPILA